MRLTNLHLIDRFSHFVSSTAEGDRKLSVVSRIDPEKRIDFTADIVLSGQKKNIAHGALYLDNDLVKSDYGLSRDNAEYFLVRHGYIIFCTHHLFRCSKTTKLLLEPLSATCVAGRRFKS